MRMVDKVLSFPLVGNMQLLHVVLICTGGAFAETIRQTVHLNQKRASELIETPNVVTGLLARKWRAERNFWLSFFCFTLWCLLAAFYRLQVQVLRLEDQLAANGDDVGSVPPRKPVQPSAPPMVRNCVCTVVVCAQLQCRRWVQTSRARKRMLESWRFLFIHPHSR